MSTAVPPTPTGASQQAVIDAALVLLERMGLSPADLAASPGASARLRPTSQARSKHSRTSETAGGRPAPA